MIDYNKIPWWALMDALGLSKQTPEFIGYLSSSEEDLWREGVDGLLWERLCHQYSTYSATGVAIPYISQAIRDAEPECAHEIVLFLETCARVGSGIPSPLYALVRLFRPLPSQSVKKAIVSSRRCIEDYVERFGRDARPEAKWLIDYCDRAVK